MIQNTFSIAQALGWLAFGILVIAFLQTSDHKTKLILTLGQFVLIFHFFLLGQPLGALLKVLSTLRDGLSMTSFRLRLFFPFLVVYILLFPLMVRDSLAIYPYMGAIIALVAFYLFSGIWLRLISIIATSLWLYYSFSIPSYGGIAQQICILASLSYTTIRLIRSKKPFEKP